MSSLRQYCSSMVVKTVMIFCNDSHCMGEVVSDENLIVSTAFAGVIEVDCEPDACRFQYEIEREGAEEIIVVGHLNCRVVPLLLEKDYDNPRWKRVQAYFRALTDTVERANVLYAEKERFLMHHHVTQQVKNLSKIPYLKEKIDAGDISVKGILVDDREPNRTEETDINMFENLAFKLN